MSEAGKSDGRFFATSKKGEVHELKQDLNSLDKNKVKDAVKKVIASMTIGKDVSALFTDVVKSMQTDNIELKKLVYLYIINYARSQPDKAILIVNTFQKDANNPSPLIRALAIRTMGCIRVDRITEYLAEPLQKACKDKDPYVRKTAAIAVAKLYDINKELVEEQGFLTALRDMVSDGNPMVVANAVAALSEISDSAGDGNRIFEIDSAMLGKLLAALNECTEWGQVFILDALAKFEPSAKEAEEIIERVTPRLKHANSAVSMSAIKVIMKYIDIIENPELEQALLQEKLPPPLITLLSEHKPEIQYVALRNINLIVQKQPNILSNGVKHFFVKYNDPIYVKMEKLEIMIKLASIKNIEKVLMEFKEYASEVDVEFVRKSVLAIGRCAIKIEKAAERCIQVLLELIQTKVNYVVQEAVIVIKDIFRKYPNRYESIIATLCENLESLDEPEAKASMIWIIGEYSDRIDNAPELLASFVEHFDSEQAQVQLQLLTATVKLFLKRPEDAKELVGQVLNLATSNADNPDLRDRGYVYWRLLSTDPEAAQQVVLASKPVINDETFQLDPKLLDLLMGNISTLASIYHKPPELFIKDHKAGKVRKAGEKKSESDDEESEEEEAEADEEEEEEEEEDEEDESPGASALPTGKSATIDLLGLGSFESPAPAAQTQSSSAPAAGADFTTVLSRDAGKGLQLRSRAARRGGRLFIDFMFENGSNQPLQQFAMKFNENYVGVQPDGPVNTGSIAPGGSKNVSMPVSESKAPVMNAPGIIQVAIKTELGVFYFNQPFPIFLCFTDDGQLPDQEFLRLWKSMPDDKETTAAIANRAVNSVDEIRARFSPHNIFYIAARTLNQQTRSQAVYFSMKYRSAAVLLELKLDGSTTSASVKSDNTSAAQAIINGITTLIQ